MMSFFNDFLKKIQNRSLAQRKLILFILVFIIFLAIFFIWIKTINRVGLKEIGNPETINKLVEPIGDIKDNLPKFKDSILDSMDELMRASREFGSSTQDN